MSVVGSSPAELLAAAAELESSADWVRTSAAEMSGSLGSLSWAGAAALQFTDMWSSRYKPALATTEGFLRDQSMRLRQQAQQQLAASGEESAPGMRDSSGMPRLLASLGGVRAPSWAGPSFDAAAGGFGLLGVAGALGGFAATKGRYSRAWSRVIAAGGDMLRFKRSPILQAVSGSPTLTFLRKVADKKVVAGFGKTIGFAGTLGDAARVVGAIRDGSRYDVFDTGTDAVTGLLKGSKNPVLSLGGMGISAWKEFGTVLGKSVAAGDWKAPPPNPFHGDTWRTVYLGSIPDTSRMAAESILRIVT